MYPINLKITLNPLYLATKSKAVFIFNSRTSYKTEKLLSTPCPSLFTFFFTHPSVMWLFGYLHLFHARSILEVQEDTSHHSSTRKLMRAVLGERMAFLMTRSESRRAPRGLFSTSS